MPRVLDLVYLLALGLLSPWLIWRSARTGRYRSDLRAKLLGVAVFPSPLRAKSTVWFHGVSVGEIHLLGPLVARFQSRFPDACVVISATTDTGLAEARRRFPDAVILPFPFDFSWAVNRTLQTVRPDLVVLAESELWPNFLAAAEQAKIPVGVINTRISPRTFRRLYGVRRLARRYLLDRVSVWGVQSEEYADRLRQLGVSPERIHVTGSIKYDGATSDRNTPKTAELRTLFGISQACTPVMIWLAGSTHAPEEAIVVAVFARIRERFPQLRLILVPRHPDRFSEVAELLRGSGLPFCRRSELREPLPDMPAVILLDSVGELGAAWGLADLGFTGGSLDGQRGGQSMIEPAGYGVPTLFGPHVWNFRDAAKRLLEAGGAIQVRDADELESRVMELLADPEGRQRMGQIAQELVRQQQGATDRTVDLLGTLLT